MDHFRQAEKLIERADAQLGRYADPRQPIPPEAMARRQADFLGAIAHGLLAVAEVLDPPARPELAPEDELLDDLMDGSASVRVPLMKLPMRKDREVSR